MRPVVVLLTLASVVLTGCGASDTEPMRSTARSPSIRTVGSACAGPGVLLPGTPKNNAALRLYTSLRRAPTTEDRAAGSALAAGVRDGKIRAIGSVYPDTTRVLHPPHGPAQVLALALKTEPIRGPECWPGRGQPAICSQTACGFPAKLLSDACFSALTYPPGVDHISGLAPDKVTSVRLAFANRAITLRVADNTYASRAIRTKDLRLDSVTWFRKHDSNTVNCRR